MNVADKYALDMTGATDNSVKLATMAADIDKLFKSGAPLPRLTFPEGILLFSQWPNLAYPYLQIVAEGECRLKGNIAFDASITAPGPQPGINGLRFEGFTVFGSVTITACHRSRFDVQVISNPITVLFCILSEFRVWANGNSLINGLILDALPGNPSLQTTACTFVNPILEGHNIGCWLKNAGGTTFIGGTIEVCNTGLQIDNGGHNRFFGLDIESNGTDLYTGSGAHDNTFWFTDPSSLKWGGSWNLTNRAM